MHELMRKVFTTRLIFGSLKSKNELMGSFCVLLSYQQANAEGLIL